MARTQDIQSLTTLLSICEAHGLTAWMPLAQRVRMRSQEPLTIVVLGRMKAGKSTLLNRLCGDLADRLLPVGADRVTARMTELVAGPREAFFRVAADGEQQPLEREAFRDLVRGRGEAGVLEETRKLRVELPALGELGSVRLVDAPGFDSLNEEDAVWVKDYLPDADAIVYCVEAGTGLTHNDLRRLRELAGNDPAVGGFGRIQVLLTKADLPAGPEDAAAVLEQTCEQMLAEFGHAQVRLVAAAPREGNPVGVREVQEWICALAALGVKADRVRRQTSALAGRIRMELEGRSSAMEDPQRREREQADLRMRAKEIEQAILFAEGDALKASKAALAGGAAHLAQALEGFYAQQEVLLGAVQDMDEAKDWLVRFGARRNGSASLRQAWTEAVAQIAAPFRNLTLHGVDLPEGCELEAPLVVGVPAWVFTAVEVVGTLAMLAGSGGTGVLLKAGEAREGVVLAEKLAGGAAGSLFRGLGKGIDSLVSRVPVLKPFFFSLHDLALGYARKALAGQLQMLRSEAALEAADSLEGLPDGLLDLAKLQGTLRRAQDAALRDLLDEAGRSESVRLTALSALRAALATLDTLEA